MKRNVILKIAALFLLLLTMCLPAGCLGASRTASSSSQHFPRRRQQQQHAVAGSSGGGSLLCRPKEPSFSIQNRCSSGYLTVVGGGRRVVVQVTGLNSSHPAAEIVKETCTGISSTSSPFSSPSSASFLEEHYVRYRHRQSGKYICFSRRGKVRAVPARRVDSRGRLCLFQEDSLLHTSTTGRHPAANNNPHDRATYHRIRSAARRGDWLLGFSAARTTLLPSRDDGPRHRAALPRPGPRSDPNSCGFHFHTAVIAAASNYSSEDNSRQSTTSISGHKESPLSSLVRGNNDALQFKGVLDLIKNYDEMRSASAAGGVGRMDQTLAGANSGRRPDKLPVSSNQVNMAELWGGGVAAAGHRNAAAAASNSDDLNEDRSVAGGSVRRLNNGGDGGQRRPVDRTRTSFGGSGISASHREALYLQKQLAASDGTRRNRIRHLKHKKPRPSRLEKKRQRHLAAALASS